MLGYLICHILTMRFKFAQFFSSHLIRFFHNFVQYRADSDLLSILCRIYYQFPIFLLFSIFLWSFLMRLLHKGERLFSLAIRFNWNLLKIICIASNRILKSAIQNNSIRSLTSIEIRFTKLFYCICFASDAHINRI